MHFAPHPMHPASPGALTITRLECVEPRLVIRGEKLQGHVNLRGLASTRLNSSNILTFSPSRIKSGVGSATPDRPNHLSQLDRFLS